MKRYRTWMSVFLLLVLTTACSRQVMEMDRVPLLPMGELAAQEQADSSRELVVWSYYDITETARAYMQNHPLVHIKAVQLDYEDIVDALLQSVISGEAPDIVMLDSVYAGRLNGLDVLDNLRAAPYYAQEYEARIPKDMLPLYSNLAMDKLIFLPMELPYALTFYRADLLAREGYPAEPEALAEYLSSPQRWVDMAVKLKAKNMYLFQHYTDPYEAASISASFLDQELKFNRNTPVFQDAFNISREISKKGLALRSMMWDASGQQALRDGQLIMLYNGSWTLGMLKNWVPEQAGKWRAARLPLNLYGYRDGAVIAVTKSSRNKAEAWKFIQQSTTLLQPADQPGPEAFLGGQDMRALQRELTERSRGIYPGPMDVKLKEIWTREAIKITESELSVPELLRQLGEQMEQVTSEERRMIRSYLSEKNGSLNK